jgi:2-dehydro-3-deoxygluconokinase
MQGGMDGDMQRVWRSREIVSIGEAMVEFAPVGDDLYRRGFAGDTLNTAWHLAQLVGGVADVGYVTRIGADAFSRELLDFLAHSGLQTRHVQRDAERTLGLYVISLAGAERSFSYWRENSAARRLADDPATLHAALNGAALVHVSGITLAVIGETGRANLLAALAEARAGGAVVAFDPNLRLRLWRDAAEARAAFAAMLEQTDIALPSYDDEAALWGDASAEATRERLARAGVAEIVVKNGAGGALVHGVRVAAQKLAQVRDTTGAGDAFNAGYLAARFLGRDPLGACAFAHEVAGVVVGHYGALAPREAVTGLRGKLLTPAGTPPRG